jgi:glyoxylase-like metal-dependent hydrolase (beta-lactamase superfamily II)
MEVPFSFVVAKSGDQAVLLDCGFMNHGGGAEMAKKFDVPWWISPHCLLKEIGVTPERVSDIVLSHAHFDHIGSIGELLIARPICSANTSPGWRLSPCRRRLDS